MKDWNLAELEGLVLGRIEEGPTIEYKSCLRSNTDIAKEICAFANAEGGTVIFGVEEKDKVPVRIAWIHGTGVEERIQNIARTSIQPKIGHISVFRCENPQDPSAAVFVVEVPKGGDLHMASHQYYKRRGSESVPMEHHEVKKAMLGLGLVEALKFEISSNLDLIMKSVDSLDQVWQVPSGMRKPVAVVPMHVEAWNAIVSSGLLVAFPETILKALLQVYSGIREVNFLADWLMHGADSARLIVHTTVHKASMQEHGTYVPGIIREKMVSLKPVLEQTAREMEQQGL